jgi:hypothetical protein
MSPPTTPNSSASANETSIPFGVTAGQKATTVDSQHFASLTPEGVIESVAEGLPMDERRIMFAVQGQSYGPMFDEKLTVAAWKSKPSWHVIATEDRMLPSVMEEAGAKKANGKIRRVPTCQAAMLQEPTKVADVIIDGATHAQDK